MDLYRIQIEVHVQNIQIYDRIRLYDVEHWLVNGCSNRYFWVQGAEEKYEILFKRFLFSLISSIFEKHPPQTTNKEKNSINLNFYA